MGAGCGGRATGPFARPGRRQARAGDRRSPRGQDRAARCRRARGSPPSIALRPASPRLRENLARLHLEAEIVEADTLGWHPAAQAHLVLLDAPCTATGTIRRHPDILHGAAPPTLPASPNCRADCWHVPLPWWCQGAPGLRELLAPAGRMRAPGGRISRGGSGFRTPAGEPGRASGSRRSHNDGRRSPHAPLSLGERRRDGWLLRRTLAAPWLSWYQTSPCSRSFGSQRPF